MTYKMKKEHAFWATVCLLLGVVPELLHAQSEEADDTDSELRPMKPLHTFCAMRAEDGPCKAMIRSYFFNMYTHQCEEFIYGGCEGNENRFDTLEECKETCIPGYKKKTIKTASGAEKPDFCFLEEDPGICRGFMTRYFYNNQSKQCEKFKYGGCLGNSNNFETLDECKNTCEDPVNELQTSDYVTDLNTVTDRSTVNNVIPQSTKAPRQWARGILMIQCIGVILHLKERQRPHAAHLVSFYTV
ncbi:tissue factor pathway inhibitor isoform X2 [Grammomys surdaster]|uniref:tissue factor pathway inhibitor isoform X2 n=1 Tax=Grammomys surdaster TaxID=491861 RepID=UPI00109FC8E1|nr:tissue factor pathway inhibitor isoform X2 [Grammomys surdaster]